ncbi:unnamed protein product, partial [Onchocerca flexuosa]|uniref:C2H2-type domain-containing protein n=1 Tax=Onchocerca flexuosa TaxID=387005 RepID=A0A183I8J3_9BILA
MKNVSNVIYVTNNSIVNPGCNNLKRHEKEHGEQRLNLRRHELIHAVTSSFKCDECGKEFSRSDYLKSHKITY